MKRLLIATSILISGCGSDARFSETFPLYAECESVWREFVKQHSSGNEPLRLELRRFSRISEAHPSIVGIAELSGADRERVALVANGLATACIPRSYTETALSRETFGTVKEMSRDYSRVYPAVVGERIRLYYNPNLTGAPELEYEDGTSVEPATR